MLGAVAERQVIDKALAERRHGGLSLWQRRAETLRERCHANGVGASPHNRHKRHNRTRKGESQETARNGTGQPEAKAITVREPPRSGLVQRVSMPTGRRGYSRRSAYHLDPAYHAAVSILRQPTRPLPSDPAPSPASAGLPSPQSILRSSCPERLGGFFPGEGLLLSAHLSIGSRCPPFVQEDCQERRRTLLDSAPAASPAAARSLRKPAAAAATPNRPWPRRRLDPPLHPVPRQAPRELGLPE